MIKKLGQYISLVTFMSAVTRPVIDFDDQHFAEVILKVSKIVCLEKDIQKMLVKELTDMLCYHKI